MNPSHLLRVIVVMVCLTLGACGGGGGSSGGTPATMSQVITGVAAVGESVNNAYVTVKDSNGKTVSTTTGLTGVYKASVSGMTAPLMIEVNGTASGFPVLMFSAVATLPAPGSQSTVNVTPLTNAIVALAGGGLDPLQRFTSGKISSLTSSNLSKVGKNLAQALSAYYGLAGVSLSTDLFGKAFTPDKTGIDLLLTLIDVELVPTDSQGDVQVTIAGRLDPPQWAVLDTSGQIVSGALTAPGFTPDFSAIDQLAVGIHNYTVAGKPLSGLQALIDPAFLNSGENGAAYLTDLVNDLSGDPSPDLTVSVLRCLSATLCEVAIGLATNDPVQIRMIAKQESNGTWEFYGDQRPQSLQLAALSRYVYRLDGGTLVTPDVTFDSGLEIAIAKDLPSSNAVQSAEVYAETGGGEVLVASLTAKPSCASASPPAPGLLQIDRTDLTAPQNAAYCDNVEPLSDTVIAQIGTSHSYRVQLYSDTAYTTPIAGANYDPILADGAVVAGSVLSTPRFSIGTSAGINAAVSQNAAPTGQVHFAWTAPTGIPVIDASVLYVNGSTFLYVYNTALLNGEFFANQIPVLNNTISSAPVLTPPATYTSIQVDALDPFGHLYRSKAFECGGGACT